MARARLTRELIDANRISKALKELKQFLVEGDSINLAKKKACFSLDSTLFRKVVATDEYLDLLNFYMRSRGRKTYYVRSAEGKLKLVTQEGRVVERNKPKPYTRRSYDMSFPTIRNTGRF